MIHQIRVRAKNHPLYVRESLTIPWQKVNAAGHLSADPGAAIGIFTETKTAYNLWHTDVYITQPWATRRHTDE